MSSLADLPEIVGFFSYSREDDEASDGSLSALRLAIQRELGAQLGRTRTTFRLWQDQEAIAPGRLWESEIKTAVEQALFFIPIVTPRAVKSHYCKFEFEAFLAREKALGRADLVFPLLYILVPALESEAKWRADPVLSIIGMRQYVDWRPAPPRRCSYALRPPSDWAPMRENRRGAARAVDIAGRAPETTGERCPTDVLRRRSGGPRRHDRPRRR